ncbi:iron-sulfur cluster assembly scaffold protein [Candidatus Gracilibacteria bacterium]|nr:iron-sulfur cluster assembly scaffold protein [Candidatus Gracilibacteria bacterium]
MSKESELLVKEYAKNPLCNYKMDKFDVSFHEGNFICGDDITVYVVINSGKIKEYSFDGNCSSITTAAASFLSEFIVGIDINTILNWDYKFFVDNGFDVSPKRRRAMVISLLALRNSIHEYLKDGKKDTFDDLLE